jgi:hypothetical protein
MKTTVILIALVLSLAAGAARAATTDVSDHQHVPARSGDVLAYGANTMCKLGCWG